MWTELRTPIIFAHRGDSIHAPENTLSAFKLAAKHGVEAVEFDVKLSSDGHVIVLHDQTVDRTTDSHGDVRNLPLASLKELDAGSYFSDDFKGEHIPTLEEVFETFGKQLFMNVELTNYATPGDFLVSIVAKLVKRFGVERRVLFSSYFPSNLLKAAKLLPEIPRGLIVWPGWAGWWGRTFGYRNKVYQALHPPLKDVNSNLVSRAHRMGRRVQVYTINTPNYLKDMVKLGIDGIFTDDPEMALKVIGSGL